MSDALILKKYSNRRLYDTRNSRYVTLEDVAGMIRDGEQVRIQDAATKEDVTAFILTQVVLEAAKRKNYLLPAPVLHLVIRYGDNALGEFFEKYFQKTIQNYLETKKAFDAQFGQWLDMGLDMSRRMPEIMTGSASVNTMMEMLGLSDAPAGTKEDPEKDSPKSDRQEESDA
jgi:polyhydroxyalkanoate synthesis repressor PhaR